jgi:hypothetical protein
LRVPPASSQRRGRAFGDAAPELSHPARPGDETALGRRVVARLVLKVGHRRLARDRARGVTLLTAPAPLKPSGAQDRRPGTDTDRPDEDLMRGFCVGPNKNGLRVEAVEEIRSVGPNRAGGRGCYAI